MCCLELLWAWVGPPRGVYIAPAKSPGALPYSNSQSWMDISMLESHSAPQGYASLSEVSHVQDHAEPQVQAQHDSEQWPGMGPLRVTAL